MWVLCPFLCVYLWDEGCEYSFACMRVGTYACVYVCLLSSSMCQVRAPQTPPHSSSQSTPHPHQHALPVEGCRRCVGGFSRRGQDARVSAGPLSAGRLAGPGPTGLAGPRLGVGGGGLWVSGPRARSGPGVVGCRWSLRACRHGTLGRLHCGCRSPTFGYPLPFSGWRPRLSAVVLLGVPCPGGPPDVWGPGLFHACFMPCGMGLLFPTHTIKHLHGGTL